MANLNSMTAVNYLVPSSGRTHAVPVEGVFSAQAYTIDWNQFKNDNFAFQPQGVFIDNSAGTGELDVVIYANGLNGPVFWTIKCPAGAYKTANFPAPNGQAAGITGNGEATVIFVDFPVLPDAGAVTVENTVNVTWTGNPGVTPTVNSGGTPYQNTEVPALASTLYSGAITGATKTATLVPGTANLYLRKLIMSFTGNASLASAETNLLTVAVNGTTVYEENVYLPGAAGSVAGSLYKIILDWEKVGIYCAAGDIVVTLATALATGQMDINATIA
jgi:hypothetical protein